MNFQAKTYCDLIKCSAVKDKGELESTPSKLMFRAYIPNSDIIEYVQVTEPPLTIDLTTRELLQFAKTPFEAGFECHTQTVEFGVAM